MELKDEVTTAAAEAAAAERAATAGNRRGGEMRKLGMVEREAALRDVCNVKIELVG